MIEQIWSIEGLALYSDGIIMLENFYGGEDEEIPRELVEELYKSMKKVFEE